MDFSSSQTAQSAKSSKVFKKCAHEAALAVAKNWNPGLNFAQQKDAVYKIADAVYNINPCYSDSDAGEAIGGLGNRSYSKDSNQGKTFSPLKIKYTETSATKTISYTSKTKRNHGYFIETWPQDTEWNAQYALWLSVDDATNATRISIFDETKQSNNTFILEHQDICIDPHELSSPDSVMVFYSPTADGVGNYLLRQFWVKRTKKSGSPGDLPVTGFSNEGAANLPDSTYKARQAPSGTDYVEISAVNDKIKVRTDDQIAYAVPAECNVDIVLAVPVNGAASNVNNRDLSSDTSENPLSWSRMWASNATLKTTPIYEMGQALKNFVKNNFYHTRGVYMSLIPYSGKLSIHPDRATTWTTPFSPFVSTATNTQKMIGACLYATSGIKDADLTQGVKTTAPRSGDTLPSPNTVYYWGSVKTANPIMFRRGNLVQSADYGNNYYALGNLLDNTTPTSDDAHKFLRMNLNPCYGGYANMLSMKCERACTNFMPNPYYVIEPTADLVKIYEMCNALYPIYDLNNVSNFIFLPLEWAGNMFANWTRDPQCAAASGQLSRTSKTTAGRKKAVVLLVNKPDWFEPGELTYLGYDNDFSEIPVVEGDCIRGDINYASNSSLKFADGSQYDNTIQGAKKILKLSVVSGNFGRNSTTGWYETTTADTNATVRLTFPKKYLIKVVVEPLKLGTTWEKKTCNLGALKNSPWYNMGRIGIGPMKGKENRLLAIAPDFSRAYSDDGITWTLIKSEGGDGWYTGAQYGNGVWIVINKDNRDGVYKIDENGDFVYWDTNSVIRNEASLLFANGIFMTHSSSRNTYISTYGKEWQQKGNLPITAQARVLGYGNGRWIAGSGPIYYSTDNGANWTYCDSSLLNIHSNSDEWYGACFADGYFYVVSGYPNAGGIIARSSNGSNWEEFQRLQCSTSRHRNITYYNGKIYVFGEGGGCVHIGTLKIEPASLQFPNISSSSSNCTTSGTYSVTEKREFFIEPSQITTGSDGAYYLDMNLKNIRLISAEITNRPYTKVTPTVTKSGASGSVTFTANCKCVFHVAIKKTANSATLSYTAASGTSTSQTIANNKVVEISPSTHQYIAHYDANDNPYYTIAVTTSGCSITGVYPGTLKQFSGSASGLIIDSENGGTSGNITLNGDIFPYTKTVVADSSGTATVNTSTKTITCPIGTVLHVKAVPNGKVIFTNAGNTAITGATQSGVSGNISSGATNTANGVTTFCIPRASFANNYAEQKVNFSLDNTHIEEIRLKQQEIRMGVMNWGGTPNPADSNSSGYSSTHWYGLNTWGATRNLISGEEGKYTYFAYSYKGHQINNGNLSMWIYIWHNGMKASYTLNDGTSAEKVLSGNTSQTGIINTVNGIKNNLTNEGLFLRLDPTTTESYIGFLWNLTFTNQDDCIMNLTTPTDKSTGVYLNDAGDTICFDGTGDLYVTVALNGNESITFNCPNENTAHELWNEWNFCFEPSQMTNNGNGTQSLTYSTTGNVTVTATYEYKDRFKFELKKPTNVAQASYTISGHKKEMKWTAATKHPRSITPSFSWDNKNKCVEYDGSKCFLASQDKILSSSDLGKTWSAVCNLPSGLNTTYCNFVYGAGCWAIFDCDGKAKLSYDSGASWGDLISIFSNLSGTNGYCWGGATYGNGKYMFVNCYGITYISDNGITWNSVASPKSANGASASNDGWNYGCIIVNGNWFTWSDAGNASDKAFKLVKSNNNGTSWQPVVISSAAPYNVLYGKACSVCYGSNLMMIVNMDGHTLTSTDSANFITHGNGPNKSGFTNWRGLGYANGVFIVTSYTGYVAYTTFHDGVIWDASNRQSISRDTNAANSLGFSENVDDSVQVEASNETITGISVTYLKAITPDPMIEFKKIPLPNNARYVNYSTNPLSFSSSLVSLDDYSNFHIYWHYNNKLGYYSNVNTYGWFQHISLNGIQGDFFTIDDGDTVRRIKIYTTDGWEVETNANNRISILYYSSGLHRTFVSSKKIKSDQPSYTYNDYTPTTADSMWLISAGFTLPYNVALCQWKGAMNYDTMSLLQQLTKAAYDKLKSTYGDNLRVYIILYRKQGAYKNKASSTNVNFNYSYLNNCATTVYDNVTASNIASTLNTIATDIKSWAGYQEAKNVQ